MSMTRWPALGLLALFLTVVAAAPALAAKKPPPAQPAAGKACYSPAAFEADRLLELHTELMVIGLKCRSAYPAENPFGVYNEFTRLHRSALAGAERQMIEHFRGQSGGNATRRFDTFRTELANQASRRAAEIGETEYCALMVPLAVRAPALSDAEVRELLADAIAPHLARLPPCAPLGAGAKPAAAGAAKMQ